MNHAVARRQAEKLLGPPDTRTSGHLLGRYASFREACRAAGQEALIPPPPAPHEDPTILRAAEARAALEQLHPRHQKAVRCA